MRGGGWGGLGRTVPCPWPWLAVRSRADGRASWPQFPHPWVGQVAAASRLWRLCSGGPGPAGGLQSLWWPWALFGGRGLLGPVPGGLGWGLGRWAWEVCSGAPACPLHVPLDGLLSPWMGPPPLLPPRPCAPSCVALLFASVWRLLLLRSRGSPAAHSPAVLAKTLAGS